MSARVEDISDSTHAFFLGLVSGGLVDADSFRATNLLFKLGLRMFNRDDREGVTETVIMPCRDLLEDVLAAPIPDWPLHVVSSAPPNYLHL